MPLARFMHGQEPGKADRDQHVTRPSAVTPFGEIMFDERGDATGVGYTMYTVKEGKFEQVKSGLYVRGGSRTAPTRPDAARI